MQRLRSIRALVLALLAVAVSRPAVGQNAAGGLAAPEAATAAPRVARAAVRGGPSLDSARAIAAPDALLPANRIVAFYGNPFSKRMGVLGALPKDEMLQKLEAIAAEWQAADSTTTVRPALHLIATVAQHSPGRDGMYRLRMSDATIGMVASWAETRGWLLFVDIQVGRSSVQRELERFRPWLMQPWVHLALDPEFAMEADEVPGRRIGSLDAADVNRAVDFLQEIVREGNLPPKMLVVHRFTNRMLTNAAQVKLVPEVQVIIDMDGFGAPSLKRATWRQVIVPEPVQYTGFKLFFNPRNDSPMMKPADVLKLEPVPHYIQYQ